MLMVNLLLNGGAWVQRVLLTPALTFTRPFITSVKKVPQSKLGVGMSKALSVGETLVVVDMFVGEKDLLPDVVENVLLVTSSFSFGSLLVKGARLRKSKVGTVSPSEKLNTNANISERARASLGNLNERASVFLRKMPLMTFSSSIAQKAWKAKLATASMIKSGEALVASQRFIKTYSLKTKTWFVASEKGELLFSLSEKGLHLLKNPQFQGFALTTGTITGAALLFPTEETLNENGMGEDSEGYISDLLSSYAAIIFPGVLSEQLGARVSSNFGAKLYQLMGDPSHFIKIGMRHGYSEAYCNTLLREDWEELGSLHSSKGVVEFVKSMTNPLVNDKPSDDSDIFSDFEDWLGDLFTDDPSTSDKKQSSPKSITPSSKGDSGATSASPLPLQMRSLI